VCGRVGARVCVYVFMNVNVGGWKGMRFVRVHVYMCLY